MTTHTRKPRTKTQKVYVHLKDFAKASIDMYWCSNRIAEYESRIQRLETLLEERSVAQPKLPEQPLQPADQSEPLSRFVSTLNEQVNSWPLEEGPRLDAEALAASLDDNFDYSAFSTDSNSNESLAQTNPVECSLPVSTAPGTSAGPVSSNAFTTPQSHASVASDAPIQPLIRVPTKPVPASTADSPYLSRAQCEAYLPPPELATSLISEFLVDFNTAYPLFRPQEVVEHLRLCYMGGAEGTALAWASCYTVLGIAQRLRAMSATGTPEDNAQADYYLRRILWNLPNLLLAPPSSPLVQCLLGLATLIETSSQPSPNALIVSTALHMSQCLAYGNGARGQACNMGADVEQQRRVFWYAFIKDTSESLLSNSPTTHRRDDISIKPPDSDPIDRSGSVTAAEGNWRVNTFSLRAQLALLQAEAIEQVLSVKSRITTVQAITAAAAQKVLGALRSWRSHELFQMSTEQLVQLLYRSDFVHVLALEGLYFATVYRLHSFLAMGMDTRLNPFSSDVMDRVVQQKSHGCYQDAKRLLSLCAEAPQGDFAICWFVPHPLVVFFECLTVYRLVKTPVVAAMCTVLSHTVQNPHDEPPSRAEMSDYHDILNMLATLAQKSQDPELVKGHAMCLRLFVKLDATQKAPEREYAGVSGAQMRALTLEEAMFY